MLVGVTILSPCFCFPRQNTLFVISDLTAPMYSNGSLQFSFTNRTVQPGKEMNNIPNGKESKFPLACMLPEPSYNLSLGPFC